MTFKNGVNAEKDQYGSGTKFINVMDIIAEGPITHDKIIGRVELSDRELAVNEVRYGDILFQRSSETREEVGQSNVYLDPAQTATFGGFVIRGRPITEFNPRFFDLLLRTDNVRSDMTSRSGGSTRYNIGQESLALVPVVVPPTLPEQEKIASFLDAVDGKISKMREKADGLRQFKTGLMQKLFSQELRFTREDGSDFPDWEEKPLGKMGRFTGGGTPDTNNKDYWSGDIAWISSSDLSEGNIRSLDIKRRITQEAIKSSATQVTPKGAVLIVTRVGIGKCCISPEDVCTSQDFTNFVPEYGVGEFFAYWLLFNQGRLKSLAQGTSIKGITVQDLKSLKVDVPHPHEQQKIAGALSALDAKIDAVTDQITHMETFKKGLLQKMFV
jgi:type I restriction enzyme S subunit